MFKTSFKEIFIDTLSSIFVGSGICLLMFSIFGLVIPQGDVVTITNLVIPYYISVLIGYICTLLILYPQYSLMSFLLRFLLFSLVFGAINYELDKSWFLYIISTAVFVIVERIFHYNKHWFNKINGKYGLSIVSGNKIRIAYIPLVAIGVIPVPFCYISGTNTIMLSGLDFLIVILLVFVNMRRIRSK